MGATVFHEYGVREAIRWCRVRASENQHPDSEYAVGTTDVLAAISYIDLNIKLERHDLIQNLSLSRWRPSILKVGGKGGFNEFKSCYLLHEPDIG